MKSRILKYFAYDHLPAALAQVSAQFHALAWDLEKRLEDSDEKEIALRKLLEAKDAAVRGSLPYRDDLEG